MLLPCSVQALAGVIEQPERLVPSTLSLLHFATCGCDPFVEHADMLDLSCLGLNCGFDCFSRFSQSNFVHRIQDVERLDEFSMHAIQACGQCCSIGRICYSLQPCLKLLERTFDFEVFV